jgi:ketosteroid isomerase-like protein
MNSNVRNITPTPSQTARRFLDALGAADFAELQSCLAPDVWLRALLPMSIHESQSAEEAAATFRDWWHFATASACSRRGLPRSGT